MIKRKIKRKIYKQNKAKLLLLNFLKITGVGLLVIFFIGLVIFVFFIKDLPRPEIFTEKQFIESTKIFDRTGKVLLYEIYGEEKRIIVDLDYIPEYLQQAVIVTEDTNFYNHSGIDFEGIVRSIMINLKIGRPSAGGSTIPQQLIRSAFLQPEKTFQRKIREIVLALELDRRYEKNEILEWYLNQIPLGQNAYGVEAASQIYFSKTVKDISLAESAVLAAIIQAPYRFSPYGENKELLLARKDYVLERMFSQEFLTEQELEQAKQEEISFSKPTTIKAPHFVLYIIEEYLKPKYGEDLEYLRKNGIKIYTTLDWNLQQKAEKEVKEGVERNRIYNAYNAALVALNPVNGEILAMVGSADWFADPYPLDCLPGKTCLFDPQFNVAVGTKQSPGRQPGSSFKPFVYAAAFERGYNDRTTVIDELTDFGVWGGKSYIPQNFDGLFRGEVSLRQSLAQSLNIPAVKVLVNFCGDSALESINNAVQLAGKIGITTLKPPYGPSIVLGGWEVKLLDMVSAYGVFANQGLKVPTNYILKTEDYRGNVVQENKKSPERILSQRTAQIINEVLSDNEARTPMFGPNSHLYVPGFQVAAKTGTTDDWKDAWIIGYHVNNPLIVVGVWTGNNNNASMVKNQPAATVAGPIFHRVISQYLY
jgi:membrane peptidoglycan carboxypeptidase